MRNAQYCDAQWTTEKVTQELETGLALLNSIDRPIVTFLGSARIKPDNKDYQHCKRVAHALGKRGYAVMSGGGPGVMEAANTGAMEAGTISVGIQAGLIRNEKVTGSPWTNTLRCRFLFVRRFLLQIKSDALLVYPGGFGTLNELFEYVCLVQTGLVERVPIILVDRQYWEGMREWIEGELLKDGMIALKDEGLLHFVDTEEEVLDIIEQARAAAPPKAS